MNIGRGEESTHISLRHREDCEFYRLLERSHCKVPPDFTTVDTVRFAYPANLAPLPPYTVRTNQKSVAVQLCLPHAGIPCNLLRLRSCQQAEELTSRLSEFRR
jgi:hypothetical protein